MASCAAKAQHHDPGPGRRDAIKQPANLAQFLLFFASVCVCLCGVCVNMRLYLCIASCKHQHNQDTALSYPREELPLASLLHLHSISFSPWQPPTCPQSLYFCPFKMCINGLKQHVTFSGFLSLLSLIALRGSSRNDIFTWPNIFSIISLEDAIFSTFFLFLT